LMIILKKTKFHNRVNNRCTVLTGAVKRADDILTLRCLDCSCLSLVSICLAQIHRRY